MGGQEGSKEEGLPRKADVALLAVLWVTVSHGHCPPCELQLRWGS